MLRLTQISLTKQLVYSLFMLCIHCKFFGKKKTRKEREKKGKLPLTIVDCSGTLKHN